MTAQQPLSWEARKKSVTPMPGGYGGFLTSFRWIAEQLCENSLSEESLRRRFAEQFRLTAKASANRISFLKRSGLVNASASACGAGPATMEWMQSGDSGLLIRQIHSTTRFIGEMLDELREPRSAEELLYCANEHFSMGWMSTMQINNRRGWLQSAGLLTPVAAEKLALTEMGIEFLAANACEPPMLERQENSEVLTRLDSLARRAPHRHDVKPTLELRSGVPKLASVVAATEPHSSSDANGGHSLEARIRQDALDTGDPARFEKTVRDAFEFLGFVAQHLGGSGQTDVLVQAFHGVDRYRVAVDAKTTASGSLKDQQVNWATLVEHRRQHDADYSLVIGPKPSGASLMKFAKTYGVTVLSSEELAVLCELHARNPLTLASYRSLFMVAGEADTRAVREAHREADEKFAFAACVVQAIGELQEQLGALSVDSLRVALHGRMPSTPDKESIGEMLDVLASPLIGAVEGSPEVGYVLACSPSITANRLRVFASVLTPGGDGVSQ